MDGINDSPRVLWGCRLWGLGFMISGLGFRLFGFQFRIWAEVSGYMLQHALYRHFECPYIALSKLSSQERFHVGGKK